MAIFKLFKIGIILVSSLFICPQALANNSEFIPSVSKLKNIQTTDWEYRALQTLDRRYDCTSPWQKSSNNSSLDRYEFSVGLNKCLQQIVKITSQENFKTLQKLQQDFALELARLTTKVEQLETKVTQIESQQFSTTIRFNGQILFF